jgi:predicted DNA-binding antitoxin AbrB/MazE fold protein
MTTQLEAIYEQGVLRPLQPLDLDEGVKVEIILVSLQEKRTPYEILSAIAAMPLEGDREESAGREHDRFLYGGQNGEEQG